MLASPSLTENPVEEKLEEVERRFERITADLMLPKVISNPTLLTKLTKERAMLEPVVDTYRAYRKTKKELAEHQELVSSGDAEMRALAADEVPALEARVKSLTDELAVLLLPRDPHDDKDVLVEIRAAAGGDEAALFAEELSQMYLRLAQRRGWTAQLVDVSEGNRGGIKDTTLSLRGDLVYSTLRFEGGVHRVQRVPATETQGRIHTSTVTVAVLPEAEELEVKIDEADIELQVMRSTGSGGQSVNTTDSAVRLIHRPTGIVVKCQQEKSQLKNRTMAMKMLRAKLYALEQERQQSTRDSLRRDHVGSGDRSEKIRTYNFPQDRLTDHRIGFSRHALDAALSGDIDDLLVALQTHFRAEALRASVVSP